MHKCLKCGTEFDGKFCPECGAKYVDPDACPECGAKHPPEAKFCPECGARLDGKVACPRCGALSESGAAFCIECGASLKGGKIEKKKGGSISGEKVKGVINLVGVICVIVSALVGLAFTFACGVSITTTGNSIAVAGTSDTNLLYYYFGDAYDEIETIRQTLLETFNWKNIGGAREFALYFPVILGTVASAVGILGVVALSAFTGFKAYKKYVKKQQANVVAPAVATFLTFATLATILLSLSAGNLAGSIISFTSPTLAGLIVGGVFMGVGLLLIAGSHYEVFKGFNAAVASIVAVTVCALTVVVLALASLPVVNMKIKFNVSTLLISSNVAMGLLPGMRSMLLLIAEDDKIFKFITYGAVGGVAGIALAVISAVTLFRKIPAAIEGKNKSNIILCAVMFVLAVLDLVFSVLFANELIAEREEADYEIRKNLGVVVAILVFTVLALAAEIAGKFVHIKSRAAEVTEEITEAAENGASEENGIDA